MALRKLNKNDVLGFELPSDDALFSVTDVMLKEVFPEAFTQRVAASRQPFVSRYITAKEKVVHLSASLRRNLQLWMDRWSNGEIKDNDEYRDILRMFGFSEDEVHFLMTHVIPESFFDGELLSYE